MKLAQTILENERAQNGKLNSEIIGKRLKELVYGYNDETVQLLHKTGIAVSSVLPSSVLHSIVVKNLATNSELRDAVAKVILEQDNNYASADGSAWQLIGGALGAVGSVLSGLGRGQTDKATTDAQAEQIEMQKQHQQDLDRAKQIFWTTVGISSLVIIGLIIGIVVFMKSKSKVEVPKTGISPKLATP